MSPSQVGAAVRLPLGGFPRREDWTVGVALLGTWTAVRTLTLEGGSGPSSVRKTNADKLIRAAAKLSFGIGF